MTRGMLWNVESCIDLLATSEGIRVYAILCRKFNRKIQRRAGLEVLKAIVNQLFISNREPLAELVVSLAVGHFDSPRKFHSTVQQLRDWYWRGGDWPSHVELGKTGVPLNLYDEESDEDSTEDEQMLPNLFDMPNSGRVTHEPDPDLYEIEVNDTLIPREWGNSSLLRWIFQTIYFGIPLPVGTCQSDDGKANEHAIFRVNPGKTRTIFVPLTELDYEFGYSLAIHHQAKDAFWSVQMQEGVMLSNEEKLEAQKKLYSAKVKSWPIADWVLAIRDSKRLSGVWSPVLCANGVLKWDKDSRSYSLIPLGSCESVYSKVSIFVANMCTSRSMSLS